MRKILISKNEQPPRTTLDPSFDTLNNFFKRLMQREKPLLDTNTKEDLDLWNNCEETQCSECLLSKHQEWIFSLNLKGVYDLCTLIDKSLDRKLKKNKHIDMMDYGVRLPGSGFSKQ